MKIGTSTKEAQFIPPYSIPPQLQTEREARAETMNYEEWIDKITRWLHQRPLIAWSDSDARNMVKLVSGEIKEFEAELLTAKTSVEFQEVWKEVVDVLFFCLGFLASNQYSADFAKVRRQMNGWDDSQSTIDYQLALAAQIEGVNPVATIERLLTVWSSSVVKLQHWFEVNRVLDQVLIKNSGNYPTEYFQLKYFFRGKLVMLTQEEYELALTHRIRCLRTIRHVVKLLRPHDPVMRAADHNRYSEFILDHRSPSSFNSLCMQICVDNRTLTLESVLQEERQPHRLVAGVLRPGQELYVVTGAVYPINASGYVDTSNLEPNNKYNQVQ